MDYGQLKFRILQIIGLESRLSALEEGGGAGGNHAALSNLDYASSGHSGFMPTTTIPDQLSDLADDSTHRLVTDTEKTTWNGKLANTAFSGLTKITVGPTEPVDPSVGDLWINTA